MNNTGIFWCEHKHKCKWQVFALHQGYGIGNLNNVLPAWENAHQQYCGGKLIQGVINEVQQEVSHD